MAVKAHWVCAQLTICECIAPLAASDVPEVFEVAVLQSGSAMVAATSRFIAPATQVVPVAQMLLLHLIDEARGFIDRQLFVKPFVPGFIENDRAESLWH